jgi:hypothetical protein
MAIVPVYVEALPDREEVLHLEGAKIELPLEKEEYIPSVSKGEETEDESPPALEGVWMFFIFLRHWFHEGTSMYKVLSKMI